MGVVSHKACTECGSRDNVAVYSNGGEHCFTPECTYHIFGEGEGGQQASFTNSTYTPKALEMTGQILPLKDRRISADTCKKFGVTAVKGADGNLLSHYYPYYNTITGELTATKKRTCATKDFMWSGDRTGTGLFGQQTCKGKGKYITVVEGECDALAVSEMFDNKWDVVSLRDGAQSAAKDISAQLEFLEGYDNIIICFDRDKHGEAAYNAVKDKFSPNKVKHCVLPMKDAGAMLAEGKIRQFTKSWWDAKAYLPAGIVKVSETWEDVLLYRDTPSIPYPWQGLNDILMGQRRKEINIWAAETGIGKSQTMREIQDFLVQSTKDEVVGCLMLEESIAKTTLGWMSFKAGRPLHKELSTIPNDELRKYWELATAGDRMVLLDHKGWGSNMETLKARMRYMKHAMNCNTIILDHLHIALSTVQGASGDWAGIDELMTDLVHMVNELDICLHLVCHTSGDRSLRGSKGISKLADAVIFLERDKHHEDAEIANTTAVVVDKNRWSGDVGTACYLRYDPSTHRMTECAAPIDDGGTDGEF